MSHPARALRSGIDGKVNAGGCRHDAAWAFERVVEVAA